MLPRDSTTPRTSIGTNGLGTSMVEKRALLISGSQHYNDALATLACAAAPVCTPSGSVIGSISLGGPIESANPLMLSLTREIGQQIEERLRSSARPQDLALAMSFTRYTNSQRPTVVMDSESILANTPGLPYIDVTSHRHVVGTAEQSRLGVVEHAAACSPTARRWRSSRVGSSTGPAPTSSCTSPISSSSTAAQWI